MLSRRSFLGRAAALAAATGLIASGANADVVPQTRTKQGDFMYYQSVETLAIGDHVVMDSRDMMRIRKQRSKREKIHGVCVNFDPRMKIALVRLA